MSAAQLDPRLVGEVIASFRRKKGLTQEVLSGLADLGRTHLSAIEHGERKPTLETLYRLSGALEVPMWVIVKTIEEEMRFRPLPLYQGLQPRKLTEPALCHAGRQDLGELWRPANGSRPRLTEEACRPAFSKPVGRGLPCWALPFYQDFFQPP